MRVCIEIKGDTTPDFVRHAQNAVNILQRRGNLRNVVISSFNPECLQAIKTWEPRIATALDPDKQDGSYAPWQLCEKVLECGANFLLHRYQTLTSEIIDECHQHGFNVWTWTVNHEDAMRHVLQLDVDGIMTDYPARLAQVICSEG